MDFHSKTTNKRITGHQPYTALPSSSNDILLHFYVISSQDTGEVLASHDLPILESIHLFRLSGQIQVMGYYYHGQTLAIQVSKQFEDHLRGCRVKVPSGFVCQDDIGIVDQGAPNGHTLHLASRELSGQMISSIGKAHHLQDFINPAFALILMLAAKEQGKLDVFARRKGGHEIELLEDETDIIASQANQLALFEPFGLGSIQSQAAS